MSTSEKSTQTPDSENANLKNRMNYQIKESKEVHQIAHKVVRQNRIVLMMNSGHQKSLLKG